MNRTSILIALLAFSGFSLNSRAQDPPWVSIQGNVRTVTGIPVCALVLANGQYLFSCGGSGGFNLDAPLDPQGQVTLFAFADGFAPYRVTAAPSGLPAVVQTKTADPNSPLIAMTRDMACAANIWVHLSGEIESFGGEPLCALVLANGQHMFSCGASQGRYDLNVPPDENGNITLFGFADGFQPYSETFVAPECDALVGTWATLNDGTITFGSDGTYYTSICGFEAGTYVYDPAAQRFTSIVATQDDNGDCGLANNFVPYLDLLVRREGDNLVVNNGEEILYKVQ